MNFTSAEVSRYYAARVPRLEQTGSNEWRGPCPIHKGQDENFTVHAETGRWFCHSRCARGGDQFELETALTGADFPTSKAEVLRIIGRTQGANGHRRGRILANSTKSRPAKPTEPG